MPVTAPSELLARHDQVMADLVAKKATCESACAEPVLALQAVDPAAMSRAMVAHHVAEHGDQSVIMAYRAGPVRFLDQQHLDEVARVQQAVMQDGADPTVAAGADPAHVALLVAAHEAHAPHKEELAAAYALFSATNRELAIAENPEMDWS